MVTIWTKLLSLESVQETDGFFEYQKKTQSLVKIYKIGIYKICTEDTGVFWKPYSKNFEKICVKPSYHP